jgi:hypothetical protein
MGKNVVGNMDDHTSKTSMEANAQKVEEETKESKPQQIQK